MPVNIFIKSGLFVSIVLLAILKLLVKKIILTLNGEKLIFCWSDIVSILGLVIMFIVLYFVKQLITELAGLIAYIILISTSDYAFIEGPNLMKTDNIRPKNLKFLASYVRSYKYVIPANSLSGWNEPIPGDNSTTSNDERPAIRMPTGCNGEAICDISPLKKEKQLLEEALSVLRINNSFLTIFNIIDDPKTRQYIIYAAKDDSERWFSKLYPSNIPNARGLHKNIAKRIAELDTEISKHE